MELNIKNKLLSAKTEELNKLSKKEIVSLYKEVYNSNEVKASRTKALLIEDIMVLKNFVIRNEAIKRLVV